MMHPLETENLNLTLAAAFHLRNKGISMWSFSALTVWGVMQPLAEVGQVGQTEEQCSSCVFFVSE